MKKIFLLPQFLNLMANINNLLADVKPINFPIVGWEGNVQALHLLIGIGSLVMKGEQNVKIVAVIMNSNVM